MVNLFYYKFHHPSDGGGIKSFDISIYTKNTNPLFQVEQYLSISNAFIYSQ